MHSQYTGNIARCLACASTSSSFAASAQVIQHRSQVHAGESQAESRGYVLTNPVAKTSMDSGLSQLGKQQVHAVVHCATRLSTDGTHPKTG